MADWTSIATGSGDVLPVQSGGTDWTGIATGTAQSQAAAKPANKDLTYDYDRTLGFKQQAVGSFASDDAEWLRHSAKSLYPDEPVDRSVKRFGQTKEGRYYHKGDDGKLYEVTPPSGAGRVANIGGGIGHALPVGGATVAGITTAPMAVTGVGLLGTMGATAAAGAGGEYLRQKIGDYLFEPDVADNSVSVPKVLYEGAQSGLGQGVGAGMASWLNRYAAPDIGRYSAAATNRLYDKADNIGVRLTPAEATGMESLIADQKRLMGVPQSANITKDFTRERNQEVYDAFKTFANGLASPRDASVLAREGASTADDLFTQIQRGRTAAVAPFYRQAEREIGPVDPSGALRYIEQELPTAKGAVRKALESARSYMMRTGEDGVPDTSFRGLDNAKKAIDALLQNPRAAEAQGIDRSAIAALQEVRGRLVTALDTASGNSGAYQQGRALYGQITDDVVKPAREALDPLLAVGRRQSMPGGSTNLTGVAQGLLDPSKRSPEQIRQARTLIEQQDPQLWNGFVRQFLHEETTNVLRTMASGEMRNVGGGVSKALGSEPMLENIKAALTPKQFREFSDMLDVFRATARAVDSNSDTAFKQEMLKRAKQEAGGIVGRVVRNVNPAKLLENTAAFFENRNYERQAEALANIITSGDRAAINRVRALKHLEPGDFRRWSVLGDVLTRTGAIAAESALD